MIGRSWPRRPGRRPLYRRAEELAGFGSWEWIPESRRLRWSDNLFRIYGLQPGEITPSVEYVFAHAHPDDRATGRARRRRARSHRATPRAALPLRMAGQHGASPDVDGRGSRGGERQHAERSSARSRMSPSVTRLSASWQPRFAVSDALADWGAGHARRFASGQGSGGGVGVRGRDDVDPAQRRPRPVGGVAHTDDVLA